MAYPVIPAAYGFKPYNLIGGQVFAGSVRQVPIAFGYNTNIFTGDVVQYAAGTVQVTTMNATGTTPTVAYVPGNFGVATGFAYTNPATNQRIFTQYWPAGTKANDAVCYVEEDPDACFKVVVLAQAANSTIPTLSNTVTAVGYFSDTHVGTNAYIVSGAPGNTNTGISAMGISSSNPTATSNTAAGNIRLTTTAPFRVLDLVVESAYNVNTTLTSAVSGSATLTVASTTGVFPGMQVIVPGETTATLVAQAGSYASVLTVASATSITISASISAPINGVVSFVGYPEAVVKWNFGYHSYYAAAGV